MKRFRLRTLFVLTLLCAVGLAAYLNWIIPAKNQKSICDQMCGSIHFRLEDAASLPAWKQKLVERLGEHYVLDVIEVGLEAGFPFTVDTISDFTRLRKLSVCGIDPIENGYAPVFTFLELEELTFERSGLDDISGFGKLKKLRTFGLYDLTTAQQGAEVFGQLEHLTTLHLGDSLIDQFQLNGIAKSRSIEELSFTVNVDRLDLNVIGQMNQLRKIRVRRLKSTDLDLKVLLKMQNLESVEIWPTLESEEATILKLEERGIHVGR